MDHFNNSIHNLLYKEKLLYSKHILSLAWLKLQKRIVAHEAFLAMEFPRQEYWSRLPFSALGDFPDPGIEPMSPESPALPADSLPLAPPGIKPWAELSLTSEHAHWATLESAIDLEKSVVTLSTFFLLFAEQKGKGHTSFDTRKCSEMHVPAPFTGGHLMG